MSKISLEQIQSALAESNVDKDKQDKVLEFLQQAIEEDKKEKEENKIPKIRPELGVILLNDLGEITTDNFSALIYETPANFDHNLVLNNIKKAVLEHNQTKKGQKSPIKSVQEAFLTIKPKIFKNNGGIKRKTKEPVRCLLSSNKI